MSDNRVDWLTVVTQGGTTDSSGGTWGSVMSPMKLILAALTRSSPKVSSGVVTSSR